MNILTACIDPIRNKNRNRYTPDYCFEPEKFPLARAIYNWDIGEVERLVKDQKIDINTMSSKSGFSVFILYLFNRRTVNGHKINAFRC